MPISIQCPACKREYKVDDKLAGKKVKCKQCGEAISVADPEMDRREPDVLGLEDEPVASATGWRGPVGGGGGGGGASVKRCPSCRTPNNPAAVMCVACGFSLRPEPAVVVETFGVKEQAPQKKKRKFVRDPDSPMTASIDSIVNMAVWWGSIAAVGVWVVHIARSMGGLSPNYLLPLGVVIGVGVVIVAPLMMIAIKVAARFVAFIPRNDTFNRVLLSLLPPFAASLLAGWPGFNAQPFVVMAWIAAPALFIYLFRSEVKEWISTVGAAVVALFIGWWIAGMAASAVGSAVGGLYADMLPDGPWQGLATGHSPAPAPPAPEKVAVASTGQAPVASAATAPGTLPFMPLPVGASPAGNGVAETPGAGHGTVAVVTSQPPARSGEPSPLSPTPGPTAITPSVTSGPSFFADVSVEDKNLQDVRDVVMPSPPAPWMLVVKASDSGTVTAERWSVQPSAKKGVQTFSELPKQPNCYALSPNGSTLVAVVHFPKNQLQISSFDNKPPRVFPLEEGSASPTLLGFIDNTHVCLRWNLGGMSKIQIWNTYAGSPSRTIPVELLGGAREEIATSPNGRLMAMFSRAPTAPTDPRLSTRTQGLSSKESRRRARNSHRWDWRFHQTARRSRCMPSFPT